MSAAYVLKLNIPELVSLTYDVSNNVTKIGNIPYINRNVDYTLAAEGYSFSLSIKAATIPIKGWRVWFYRNTELIHIGVITEIIFKEDRQEYDITVAHIFTELRKRNTKDSVGVFDSFYAQMLTETEIRNIWSHDYSLISYRKLIEVIIYQISFLHGFTIDWTNTRFYDSYYVAWYGIYRPDPDGGTDTYYDEVSPAVTEADILFLPEQINNTGEPHVHNPSDLIDDPNTIELSDSHRVDLFELLSILCSMLGVYFIPKNTTVFYACNIRPYVPGTVGAGTYLTDDDFYEVDDNEITEKEFGIQVSYSTLKHQKQLIPGAPFYFNPRASMPQGDGTEMNLTFSDGKNCTSLTWLNHLNPIINVPGTVHVVYPRCKDIGDSVMWLQARKSLYEIKHFIRTISASHIFDSATLYEFNEVTINDVEGDTVEVKYQKFIS